MGLAIRIFDVDGAVALRDEIHARAFFALVDDALLGSRQESV